MKEKGIFIVTIGKRDLQVPKEQAIKHKFVDAIPDKRLYVANVSAQNTIRLIENFNDDKILCFKEPRIAGEALLDEKTYNTYHNFLHLPLIAPTLKKLVKQCKIDKIVLVATNQIGLEKDPDNLFHYHNDTLFFAKLLEKRISEYLNEENHHIPTFSFYEVQEEATNVDYLYSFFEKELREDNLLQNSEDQQVYLLAQGGIDQINTALTLRLIEYFPNLKLYQQKEGSDTPEVLAFPNLFIENSRRQKAVELLSNFNYTGVQALVSESSAKGPLVDLWSTLALRILAVNLKQIEAQLGKLEQIYQERNWQIPSWLAALKTTEKEHLKLKLTYLAAKVQFTIGFYGDFLWRMASLSENILKPYCEEFLGGKIKYNEYDNHKSFKKLIEKKEPALKTELLKKGRKKLIPNKQTFFKIFIHAQKKHDFGKTQEELRAIARLYHSLNIYNGARNKLIHHLEGITLERIDEILDIKRDHKDENAIPPQQLFHELDNFFSVKSQPSDKALQFKIGKKPTSFTLQGFDIFEDINRVITQLLYEEPTR